MISLANEPIEGEVFSGIPRLLFQNAIGERPLFQMPVESRWLYRRDWKRVDDHAGPGAGAADASGDGSTLFPFLRKPAMFAEIEGRDVIV